MAVKVNNIYYKLKECIEIDLVAGKNGLSNLVELFHVVEVSELVDFLQGNEIIVTTGIGLKNNQDLVKIVKAIVAKKASAMIINLGPYIQEVDNQIIDFCNENAFPLFTVPWHIYMANVLKIVAEEIANSEKKDLELVSAFKNAICFPAQLDLYIQYLERYEYEVEWNYCIATLLFKSIDGKEIEIETLRKIRKQIQNNLVFIAPRSIAFRLNSDLIICFANHSEKSIEIAMNHLILAIPCDYLKGMEVYVGIGRNTKSARCMYKTYNIAHRISKLQERLKKNREVLSYKELGVSKLFLAMDDLEIMNEYYDSVLKPLVDYDLSNGSEYVSFLDMYFDEGCHVQQLADQLFLHRNSINYKIKKIEEILNCDLNDFKTRNEILIALKLRLLL